MIAPLSRRGAATSTSVSSRSPVGSAASDVPGPQARFRRQARPACSGKKEGQGGEEHTNDRRGRDKSRCRSSSKPLSRLVFRRAGRSVGVPALRFSPAISRLRHCTVRSRGRLPPEGAALSRSENDFRVRPGTHPQHGRGGPSRRASSTRCWGRRARPAMPRRARPAGAVLRGRPLELRPRPGRLQPQPAVQPGPPRRREGARRPPSGRAFRSAPLSAHLSYLKREGVTRDGEKARDVRRRRPIAPTTWPSPSAAKDDRHHFRFIVSPEDAGEMTDLKAFTRDLAQQMESRSRHPARLGRRRSLEHRQPACPSAGARRR